MIINLRERHVEVLCCGRLKKECTSKAACSGLAASYRRSNIILNLQGQRTKIVTARQPATHWIRCSQSFNVHFGVPRTEVESTTFPC